MKKYKSNNIVLLIGNGFDLAHFSDNEQTTSYNDFANDIILKISNEIEIFLDKRDGYYSNHNNIFGTIQELKQQSIIQDDIKFLSINFKSHLFINFINNENEDDIVTGINYYLIIEYYKNNTLQKYLLENKGLICKFISNQFLGKLYDNQYKNWFDIENAYFQEIINIKNKYKSRNSEYKKKELLKLNQLNKDLVEIKNLLKEYLNNIDIKLKGEINSFFNSNKIFDDFDLQIINFNYTDTIEHYFNNTNLNYIHGNLKNNNIIFGYGNDQHKEYQEIKDLEIDEFLENFKTYKYLDNNNYNRIYDDILENNSIDDYIVLVLGHSLGATDKTLLEEIFNNEKCKQIHLFKRPKFKDNEDKLKKSFNNLVFSASRILTNEKDLRKKILNYEDSEFFP